jgi:hypothetical protein
MYAASRVQERIALAEREFSLRLEYHSTSEVDAFERDLIKQGKYVYDEVGRPCGTQNLTARDSHWMLNEQLLVMCDAAYYLTRYAFLRTEEGIVQRFKFRVPQRIYFDIICDLEERGAAVEVMVLKARQLGMSIFTELLIGHRIIFSYGNTAVIGSADQSKTSEMSRMLTLAYDMLPVWLRPQYTSRVESDRGKLLFGNLASGVTFQHGSQKFGIATGSTPTLYHCSEVALYGDAALMLIDEGLWKAVHASPSVFGVLESTGRGDKGWWADTWRYSKKSWPRCRMYPMFLPWYCGTDIYPKPAWLRMRPIDNDWRPHRDTRAHVAKSELYVRSNPLLHKHMLEQQRRSGTTPLDGIYHMPREQQWFWEVLYEEARAKGAVSSFLQEMAGDDIEALQHSEESVFGHETIAEIDTRRTRQYQCYGLSGQSIEDGHEPPAEDIDYTKERIPVRYGSNKGEVYRWELIPLRFQRPLNESDPEDAIGKLIVFHPPRPRMSYSIGVDTSEGKGEDSTVISVWASGWRGEPDTQCAEFSSSYVSHVEAFSFVLCIAAYYGQFMESGVTRWKEPYVAIEQVAAVGDTCQLQMRKMGYSNFHRMIRYDGKRVSKTRSVKMGWYTFQWSRPILTGNFVHATQNGWAEVNSPWLIDEMKHFEVHHTATGKEKLEHEDGEHDDRIFAAAMAIFCPHDMDILADRSKKRMVESAGLPRINLAPVSGGLTIPAAALNDSRELTMTDIIYSDARGRR